MEEKGYMELKEWRKETGHRYYHVYPDSHDQDSYFYYNGMFVENSKVYDLTRFRYVFFKVRCSQATEYQVSIKAAFFREGSPEDFEVYTATANTGKTGEYLLEIPIHCFDIPDSVKYNLRFIREISIKAENAFELLESGLKEAKEISFQAAYRGAAEESGETVVYPVVLKNCTKEEKMVSLSWKKYGNEVTENVSIPRQMLLKPLEVRRISVEVPVAERIVPGGYEKQCLYVLSDGGESKKVEFYTSRKRAHPYLLLNPEEIEEVKRKMKTYPWAAENYQKCVEEEKEWKAPKISGKTRYLFLTSDGHHARKCAILYRLGAGEEYKEKAVEFLKELSDPERGYVKNPRACNQELVHEGEFFKSVAFAYDLVYDSTELSIENHKNIEAVLRKFMDGIHWEEQKGNVSNWLLAETEGALYCAAVLLDMHMVYRFLYGTGGVTDILSRGVTDDGWWYEASIGYNLLAAGIFSEIVHVMSHLGMDLRYMTVPASYSKVIDAGKVLQDGLVAENWGTNHKNYRNIPMLWDSLVEFYNSRGIIFGLNDSAESKIQGTSGQFMDSRYDLAYKLYGKEAYGELLRFSEAKDRDILFGTGELPVVQNSTRGQKSVCADSAGVCTLRSQKAGVAPENQLQVVLKYGSHGGAHGHYDRCSMTNLMRCGRSLTGPENIWYSYHTFLYKFYTQTSLNHNMVTVDYKMQEAVPPKKLLFYGGKMLQAAAVENRGVWSYPPYGGWQVNGDKTFRERTWNEGRYVPVPEEEPPYAVRSGFTEPVVTRRLTVVTDDFAVNFDYARGEQGHEFQCLYHLRGWKQIESLDGEELLPNRYTEKLNDSPFGSAQFITECNWYDIKKGVSLEFEETFSEEESGYAKWMTQNRTGYNKTGTMYTKLYCAYPESCTLAVGCDPEYQGVNKQLFYRVSADGEELAKGKLGTWILGRNQVEADIRGKQELVLETAVHQVEYEENQYLPMKKTIFWGNPGIITESGEWIELSSLDRKTENIDCGYGIGRDYEGGQVKIQAQVYDKAVPAEPENIQKPGKIKIDLSGLHGVKFVSAIGGDYPVGDESQRRRTLAFHKKGKEASWITVLETTDKDFEIESVRAEDEGNLLVFMKDGREIRIQAAGLKDDRGAASVEIQEIKDGILLRKEQTE